MVNLPPEKLGSFYLGGIYDAKKKELTGEAVNYDSRDLTTHAVCVGMTGSGKTGLCIGLLEEAALDKVPALIIDPKGDMTNLMLQFDNLAPEEFQKWINPDDAKRKGLSIEDYAAGTAEKWKNGLASWGQNLDRIRDLKSSVDYTIYTPGSDAGIPVNIMGSFAAPKVDFDEEAEMLRERIQGIVAALLGMINLDVDPVRSREGILLATLFEHYWRNGEDLDLTSLIMGVQKPPMKKLGVFDVDTFFPEKDRFELAMSFNSLVASPQFQNWLVGDPLDIDAMYYTAEGKPRHSIFYIAHLSDSERMFFVTLLLNSLITWMRKQSGTTSLRSLIYFDEIFGYFPPTAQPPSKKPLLTILKQARAFGVGAVLVTQNPVDIDYKGLSNAGTWFIGKLQTDRDKARVLQGLEGAIAEAGNAAKTNFDNLITGLSSRVFLMHNVHEDEPVVYNTRWVMSYLRGPLTRPQVKELMSDKKEIATSASTSAESKAPTLSEKVSSQPPSLDPSIDVRYFAVWKSESEARQALNTDSSLSLHYEPMLLAAGKVRFKDDKRGVDMVKPTAHLMASPDEFGRIDWNQANSVKEWEKYTLNSADHPDGIQASFGDVPETMNNAREITGISKEYSDYLYGNNMHKVLEHEELKMYQQADESVNAFMGRLEQAARERRDDELDELQEKYEPKMERIEDRIRRQEQRLEEAEAEKKDRKTAELIGAAETIFSVFVKKRRRSFSSTASRMRMRRKASQKAEGARDELEDLHEDFRELEDELKEKLEDIRKKWEDVSEGLTKREVKPRRADVKVDHVMFLWHPYWKSPEGQSVSARKEV